MDQLEERILQIDQLKHASKRLQHRVDRIQKKRAFISEIL